MYQNFSAHRGGSTTTRACWLWRPTWRYTLLQRTIEFRHDMLTHFKLPRVPLVAAMERTRLCRLEAAIGLDPIDALFARISDHALVVLR